MKVAYIYRCKKQNVHSVERMFSAVEPEIAKMAEVSDYYVPRYRVKIRTLIDNIRFVKRIVKKNPDIDVFHITGDIYYTALALPKNRTVLTVLDTVTLQNSTGIKQAILKYIWFSLPIRKCKYIQAISEKTKQEIVDLFPESECKIRIIPCTADVAFVPVSRVFNKECPTILHIGTKENKNLLRVIEAIKTIKCKFKVIGKLTEAQENSLKLHAIDYDNVYNLTDEEMVKVYQECDLVMFPSLYEGFGSIPIEAHASGRPVVTSNIEPMISVSNGASCLINPYSVDSIREGVIKIINDDKYREELIQKGFENCKRFYPATVAKQYMSLYKEIVENNK